MCKERSGAERGFTIIEMLVALAVAGVLFGIAFSLFISDAKAYHRETQIAEMRQNARNAVEFISRDLVNAGYGLRSAKPAVPVVLANEPGVTTFSNSAVTVLANRQDVKTSLASSMSSPSDALAVSTATGFAVGNRTLVMDQAGSWEWVTLTSISGSNLGHTAACTKSYLTTDLAEVGLVDEISFKHDATQLIVQRKINGGPWLTIADNVEQFTLRYYDELDAEIFPATDAARRAIRRISLSLRVRTAERDRISNTYKKFNMQTNIMPRNLESLPEV